MYTKQVDMDGALIGVSFWRDNQKWIIPVNEGNRDYQEYLVWLEAGNVPNVEYVDQFPTSDEPSTEERLAALELVVSMVLDEEAANV